MRRILKPLSLMLALALPAVAVAQVYSWTDANGTVHYSQSPPAHGVKYHTVKISGMNHASGPSATPPKAADTDGSSDNTQAAPQTAAKAPKKSYCQQVQDNIKVLQGRGPVFAQGADGRSTPVNAERRAAELKRAESEYKQYCADKQQ